MANKTFCPIMTIGFEAPKKGQRDNRICMKDCAWYDLTEETCKINIMVDRLSELVDMGYVGEAFHDGYRSDEDPWPDNWRT